jgi:UDP-N-acetyl-D-galactosamine dehydrogenase
MMGMFVANKVVKLMIQNGVAVKNSNALVLGITFKENCPDIRNSKVVDIYNELIQYNINVDVYDPHANINEVYAEYGILLAESLNTKVYDSIILAVAHDEFLKINYMELKKQQSSILYDTKSFLDRSIVDARL